MKTRSIHQMITLLLTSFNSANKQNGFYIAFLNKKADPGIAEHGTKFIRYPRQSDWFRS